MQVFVRRYRDPIRVPRIENRVPRISKNHHRVPRTRENRVPTGPYRVPNIFLKKKTAGICKSVDEIDQDTQSSSASQLKK